MTRRLSVSIPAIREGLSVLTDRLAEVGLTVVETDGAMKHGTAKSWPLRAVRDRDGDLARPRYPRGQKSMLAARSANSLSRLIAAARASGGASARA